MKFPVYEAYIGDEQDGVLVMSLVESPATEVEWLTFSEDKELVKFTTDDEQHILKGVVMLADTPIYRRNGDYEYYIKYSRETLEKLAEKMLSDHTFNRIDSEHNHLFIDGAQLRELYVKDSANGIIPQGFESVPDGSLLCTYHIDNMELWDRVKKGEFKGFSLEGCFSVKESYNNKKTNKKMSKIQKLKDLLQEILVEFSSVKTKDGVELEIAADEVVEGIAIKAEDGEYELEDGRKITVSDGVITSVADAEVEEPKEDEEPKEEEAVEEPKKEESGELEVTEEGIVEVEPKEEEIVEEPKEEEVVEVTPEVVEEIKEEENIKAEVDALASKVGALEAMIEDLRKMLQDVVQTPVVAPIEREFGEGMFSKDYNKWNLDKWVNRNRK